MLKITQKRRDRKLATQKRGESVQRIARVANINTHTQKIKNKNKNKLVQISKLSKGISHKKYEYRT